MMCDASDYADTVLISWKECGARRPSKSWLLCARSWRRLGAKLSRRRRLRAIGPSAAALRQTERARAAPTAAKDSVSPVFLDGASCAASSARGGGGGA